MHRWWFSTTLSIYSFLSNLFRQRNRCFLYSGWTVFAACIMGSMLVASCDKSNSDDETSNNFVCAAASSQNGFYISGGSGASNMFVMNISSDGNIFWGKTVNLGAYCDNQAMIPTSDGPYILCKQYQPDIQNHVHLLHFNDSGDLLSSQDLTLSTYAFNLSKPMRDDRFFTITGRSLDSSVYQAMVIRLSLEGEVVLERHYGIDRIASAAVATQDNGYLILVRGTTLNDRHSYLIRTDAAGDTLWIRDTGLSDFEPEVMLREEQGTFLVSGAIVYDGPIGYPFICRFDASGNTIWTGGGSADFNSYTGLVEYGPDQIYVAGFKWVHWEAAPGPYSIQCLTSNRIAWQQNCQNGNSNRDAHLCGINGGILLAGTTMSGKNQHIYLAKYDPMSQLLWKKTIGN